MTLVPWGDLSNAAYGAGTALGDMIRGAGGFYCDIIRQYPNWSLQNPLGIDPISRGINDRLCGTSPPLPLPDQPGLPGGKCFCSRYRVFYTVEPDNGPSFSAQYDTNGPVTVIGWVRGLNSGTYNYRVVSQNESCNGVRTENLVANVSQTALNNNYKVRVTNITLIGSGQDNCGGQVPRYTPIQPPPEALQRPVNITLAPNVNIAIPVAIVRPNIDINFNPNVNISLQPQFNFGDLGINIGFDLGGVNINNNFNFPSGDVVTFPVDPRPNPPQLPPGQSTDTDLTEVYRRLRNITERLVRIEECACDVPEVLTPVNLGSGNSGTFTLPNKTRFVVLTITGTPQNPKSQTGFNAPNVLYGGWAWFRNTLNSMSEREPVDAAVKYFLPTEHSTAFCYTLYGGYSGSAVAYRAT